MKRPIRFVGARGRALNVQEVRLARGSRAPPRIWTVLISPRRVRQPARRRAARAALIVVVVALTVGVSHVAPVDPARIAALMPRLGDLLLVGFSGTLARATRTSSDSCARSASAACSSFGRNVADPDQVAS